MQDQDLDSKGEYPKNINDLIDKVGGAGKYQRTLLIIFCGTWLVTGCTLLGTPFIFLNTQFQCQENGLLVDNCQSYVCSLPKQQWTNYEPQNSQIDTVATDFGPFYYLATSSTYLGALVGYILFSFYSDNFGRRSSLLLAWGIATLGSILLAVSENIYMAGAAMFLLSSGGDASINICFYFLGEIVEDKTRQKYSILIQPWFATGALVITFVFYFVQNWRIVCVIVMTGPAILLMILIFFYVEETPLFLLRKGIKESLKALNRIGKINRGVKQIVSPKDIKNVINEQVQQKQFHRLITIVDLFRFTSLRTISIFLCLINFVVLALYYGPALSIDSIGFNIYISSVVIQLSELIVYFPLYKVIDQIPRRKAGVVLFSITLLCSFILLFLTKAEDCDFCTASIVELVFIFIFRVSISTYFITLYIYMVELYPARSRAIGNGIVSAFGTLASTLSPLILGLFSRNNIDIYIFFCVCGIVGLGSVPFLPQTLGLPLRNQIQEIQIEKQKYRIKKLSYNEVLYLTKSQKQPQNFQKLQHMVKSE